MSCSMIGERGEQGSDRRPPCLPGRGEDRPSSLARTRACTGEEEEESEAPDAAVATAAPLRLPALWLPPPPPRFGIDSMARAGRCSGCVGTGPPSARPVAADDDDDDAAAAAADAATAAAADAAEGGGVAPVTHARPEDGAQADSGERWRGDVRWLDR